LEVVLPQEEGVVATRRRILDRVREFNSGFRRISIRRTRFRWGLLDGKWVLNGSLRSVSPNRARSLLGCLDRAVELKRIRFRADGA
jgi:hypothetical protein